MSPSGRTVISVRADDSHCGTLTVTHPRPLKEVSSEPSGLKRARMERDLPVVARIVPAATTLPPATSEIALNWVEAAGRLDVVVTLPPLKAASGWPCAVKRAAENWSGE